MNLLAMAGVALATATRIVAAAVLYRVEGVTRAVRKAFEMHDCQAHARECPDKTGPA